jgi:hypothetical protein
MERRGRIWRIRCLVPKSWNESTVTMRRPLPAALVFLSACGAVGPMPSYEPRAVAVPAECEAAIQRAVSGGAAALTEAEARTVEFCQHQQLLRAAEEEAAARKLDAHARTAGLALQVTTIVVGATIAILAWAF